MIGQGPAADPPARHFGRRKGRRLRPGRARLLSEALPRCDIGPAVAGAAPGSLDPRSLFPGKTAVWLEIGFGAGEHLVAQAVAHPDIGLVGVEPFQNGLAACLRLMEARSAGNIRVLGTEAAPLLVALAAASIERLFVLFSDPWPKKRHRRRRLVQASTLAEFARILTDGGELRLASDDPGYQRWMLQHLLACPDLLWTARCVADWRIRPADWPATRYEAKAVGAGRQPIYLRFLRRPRSR